MRAKDLNVSKARRNYFSVEGKARWAMRKAYKQAWQNYEKACDIARKAYMRTTIKAWEAVEDDEARADEHGKGAEANDWKAFVEAGLGKSLEDIQKEANEFTKQGGRIRWEDVK